MDLSSRELKTVQDKNKPQQNFRQPVAPFRSWQAAITTWWEHTSLLASWQNQSLLQTSGFSYIFILNFHTILFPLYFPLLELKSPVTCFAEGVWFSCWLFYSNVLIDLVSALTGKQSHITLNIKKYVIILVLQQTGRKEEEIHMSAFKNFFCIVL